MKKTLLTSLVMGLTTSAFAIPSPIPSANELPEFTDFDTEITVPAYADRVIYKFNPPTVGILTFYCQASGDMPVFLSTTYYSDDYTILRDQYRGDFIEDLPQGYNFGYATKLTPENQYYISIPPENYNQASKVMFTWEELETKPTAVTVVTPSPTVDASFDYLTNNQILVEASQGISSFGEITISYNDVTEKISGNHLSGPPSKYLLVVAIAEIGSPNYAKQAVDAGAESFTVTIKDLYADGVPVTGNDTNNDNITVDNGTVTITYSVAKALSYLPKESSWPSTFYSYWEEGDPNAVATLVFDEPVKKVDQVTVTMAQLTQGSEGGEEIVNSYFVDDITIDGSKVYIDFAGIEYYGNTKTVTVIVMNVTGESGLPANMGGGNLLFQYIPYSSDVAPDYPGSGSVDSLASDLIDAAIYNINGVRVNTSIHTLPSGLYIINGKKIIVK